MSAATYECNRCGAVVFASHREHHAATACKDLARLKRKREYNAERMRNKRRGRPTKRGYAKCALEECEEEFLSEGVHHRFCCPRHADIARAGGTDTAPARLKLEMEMEPLERAMKYVQADAEAVRMVTGAASHALWFRCLGVPAEAPTREQARAAMAGLLRAV